jgi:predicted outer membrane repeat protein
VGDNTAPYLPAIDFDGNPRVVGAAVDLGAIEVQDVCSPSSVLYVKADAPDGGDGGSWINAFNDLQTALYFAKCPNVSEIWVATGTYRPTTGGGRLAAFGLINGKAIYGGFAGTESSVSERDLSMNESILSGDIGITGVDTDNSYHVVTGHWTNATAVLDGFTITAGHATGGGDNAKGGGLFVYRGSPTINNIIFHSNVAAERGGAAQIHQSNPIFANVVFLENYAYNGGAISVVWYSNPKIVNATFAYNSCGDYFYQGSIAYIGSYCNSEFINSIFFDDPSSDYSQFYVYDLRLSTTTVSSSLFDGGLPYGCTSGGGNRYNTDPLFIDGTGGNLRLSSPLSPAFNAGNNAAPYLPFIDLDGTSRIVAGTVDMGAYEYAAVGWATAIPSPTVFTDVPSNHTTCDTLRIINDGGVACTINGIVGCDMLPFSIDTTMTAHALAPGDTTKMVLCVTPKEVDPDTTTVTIFSDAWNSPATVEVRIDAVTSVEPDRTPKPFRIVSVAPNPFNPSTTVHFTLPAAMPVTATVYSVTGARVRLLAADEPFEPGDNRLVWNGRNDRGSVVASGVYFVRITTQVGAKVARAVLLK